MRERSAGSIRSRLRTPSFTTTAATTTCWQPKGSEVLVSPITDPGSLAAIVLDGLKPRLVDSKPASYNIGLQQFVERITPDVSAALVVHSAGQACEIDKIVAAAHERGIKVA